MLAYLGDNIFPTRFCIRGNSAWGAITQFPIRESWRDPVSANNQCLRTGKSCHIRKMDGEGAVVVEPIIPPARITRRGLPEIIRVGCKTRMGEQRNIQIDGACL